TASSPSPASPTTVKPGWHSSSHLRPARTMPWSSAIRMRTTGGASVTAHACEGDPLARIPARRRVAAKAAADPEHPPAGHQGTEPAGIEARVGPESVRSTRSQPVESRHHARELWRAVHYAAGPDDRTRESDLS